MKRALRRSQRGGGGFTLIELLIVLAILSVLAAILFPVFASAREKARQTTCASNLRQIGMAYIMYASDSDERVTPYFYEISLTPKIYQFWDTYRSKASGSFVDDPSRGLLQPYMNAKAVVDCPDASLLLSSSFGGIAYGYNNVYLSPNTAPIQLSQAQATSSTVVATDAAYVDPGGALHRIDNVDPPSVSVPEDNPAVHGRHSGRANTLWLDGHVKAMAISYPDTQQMGQMSQAHMIGDLLSPDHPYDGCTAKTPSGKCGEDYYFTLDKPS